MKFLHSSKIVAHWVISRRKDGNVSIFLILPDFTNFGQLRSFSKHCHRLPKKYTQLSAQSYSSIVLCFDLLRRFLVLRGHKFLYHFFYFLLSEEALYALDCAFGSSVAGAVIGAGLDMFDLQSVHLNCEVGSKTASIIAPEDVTKSICVEPAHHCFH